MSKIPNITLNNVVKMPILGLGVYLIDNNCPEVIKTAIDLGYRHFDTAQYYGNEKEVGEGIRLSKVPRSEIFVTTKLQTGGYDSAKKGIESSLKRFGFPYFDLILIHWPTGDDVGTYKALEEAYKEGKCKAIGLSNFNESQFLEIYNKFKIKPAINQIETHLYYNQKKMNSFLKKYNCVHESYSPFGGPGARILNNSTLISIAKKYSKSPAQIALKYLLNKGIVVIPKSSNKNRMMENLNLFDFQINDEDIKILETLDTGRGRSWPSAMSEEFYKV
jgi:diketogulonate reductase-like aldo/keto reductase